MTPEEHKSLDGAMESLAKLIALEREKIETMRKLRRGLWLGKYLDVHPSKMGKLRVSAFTESVSRQFKDAGWLRIKHEGEITEARLRDVPVGVWPDTIETPRGPQPLKKPICNE